MKFIKILVAGVLCITILMGLTGCIDGLQDALNDLFTSSQEQTETTPTVTTPHTRPAETTPPEESKRPEETTSPQQVTTPPAETTKKPDETSTPGETTTENSGTVVTPIEDLPADEDGYQYPEYFYNLVNKTMANVGYVGNGTEYYSILKSQTPEIIFVERGEYTDNEETPIVIYAKYCTNPNTNEFIYTRLSFKTGGNDYGRLGRPSRYSSYAEYIAAVQAALEKKAEVLNVDVSLACEKQDELNDKLGLNFARCLGANFVDACVNHTRKYRMSGVDGEIYEISGFAYDKEGKSYSYVVKYQQNGAIITSDGVIECLQQGIYKVDQDFKMFEVTSKPIDGVFQSPETVE